MHKSSLNKTSIVSNSVLDIVHSDVWGLAPLKSVPGFNYYVIFVDNRTRFTWLFLLKHKHEVHSVFKHFKAFVETQYSTKINVLRTDNGIEYTNIAFQAFVLPMAFFIKPPIPILHSKMVFLRLRLVHVKYFPENIYFLKRKIFSSVWLYYENFSRK